MWVRLDLARHFNSGLTGMSLSQIKDNKIYTCIHKSLTKVSMETYSLKASDMQQYSYKHISKGGGQRWGNIVWSLEPITNCFPRSIDLTERCFLSPLASMQRGEDLPPLYASVYPCTIIG